MSITHVGGVDPGLVHTGVVLLTFDSTHRTIEVEEKVVLGLDVLQAQKYLDSIEHVFIEGYRPRGHLHADADMQAAVRDMKRALPRAQVLQNTGVQQVVRRPLMELLGVWRFATATHHQDLRSAARIAILGMLKDEELNRLLADVVRDHQEGKTWHVEH